MKAHIKRNYFGSIRGILLDVDGTLYHQLPVRLLTIFTFFWNHCYQFNYFYRSLRIIYFFRKALEDLRNRSEDNDIQSQQIDMTVHRSGESKEFVYRVIEDCMFQRPLAFLKPFRRKGMINFIKTASEKGYIVGVLSDYPCKNKLERLGIDRHVSCIVTSYDKDVRALKPASRCYLHSCKKMKIPPQSILCIGDRIDTDGFGAIGCGMRFILIGAKLNKNIHFLDFHQASSFQNLHKDLFEK